MRLEYKYLVRYSDLGALRAALKPYIEVDNVYNDVDEYTVRSIYFDTSKLKYYHEKIEGINIRKKLRIRGYNLQESESIIFLEIKRKHENYINKNRSPLKYYHLEDLIKTKDLESYVLTENGFTNSLDDAEKFLHHIYKRTLKPIVLVVYEREAFYSKFDKRLRLTFDKNLRFSLFPTMDGLYSDDKLNSAMPEHFIFEIKFGSGFPKWLSNILNEFNLSRMALSKYTICLEKEKMFNPANRRSLIGRIDSFDPFHSYTED
jgi:hypothetical protein